MKRTGTTRRKRTQMKACVYLAVFGPDDTEEPTDDATADAGGDGDTADGDPSEE